MSRRLPPPLTVVEGVTSTTPMGGVLEMNDAQRDTLYSKEAAETFGIDTPPGRVRTEMKDRRRHKTLKVPTMLEQQKIEEKVGETVGQNSVKTVVSDTANTCLQACTGAVYDFWNWNQLPGKASTKMHTIATRGGRGPYLLLTFVTFVVVVFCLAVLIRSMSQRAAPVLMHYGYKPGFTPPPIGPTYAQRNPGPQTVQTMFQRFPSSKPLADGSILRLAPTRVYKYA